MSNKDITQKQNSKSQKKIKKPKKITADYLHNSGLYYLERFASSTENFRRVMKRKIDKSCFIHQDQNRDDCLKLLEALVEKFQRLELLDDDRYTAMLVNAKRRAGKSERYIKNHLSQKGVANSLISKALETYENENDGSDDYDAALIYARKKRIGPYRGSKESNAKKELSSLARAGFSYEIAKKIIEFSEEEYAD